MAVMDDEARRRLAAVDMTATIGGSVAAERGRVFHESPARWLAKTMDANSGPLAVRRLAGPSLRRAGANRRQLADTLTSLLTVLELSSDAAIDSGLISLT
jgi:hypothetical protein